MTEGLVPSRQGVVCVLNELDFILVVAKFGIDIDLIVESLDGLPDVRATRRLFDGRTRKPETCRWIREGGRLPGR